MDVVGIYMADESGLVTQALKEGARSAGLLPRVRSASDFRDGDTEDFDFAVLTTMRARGEDILRAYEKRKVMGRPGWRMPIWVMDYGFLNRVHGVADFQTGHWQACEGRLNNVVSYYCPPDRFEMLGLTLTHHGGDPKGYVLVCGQHAGDPSHGLSVDDQVGWATDMVLQYSATAPVVYRPHPASPTIVPATGAYTLSTGTIDDALAGARLLVTICSNSGHDALLAGVPAVASIPDRAAWGELSGAELPGYDQRLRYFSRVACSQWTLEEIRSGQWFKFLAHVDGRENPFGHAPEIVPTTVPLMRDAPPQRGRAASSVRR